MQRYFNNVTDHSGNRVVGAAVAVYDADGGLATIYSDDGLTTTGNPLTTDSNGEFGFYAANGVYSLTISRAGSAIKTVPGILLEDIGGALGAASVGFIQSGAGSVPRTALDKLRDLISVEDFGAVGDGATDDYAAVQAALAAAAGRRVFFSRVYRMAGGTPVIASNTHVTFLPGAALIQPNKGAYAGFAIAPGSQNITIEGADIRGPYYGVGPAAWVGTGLTATVDGDTWAAHLAENIGIDVRGRWYQRQTLGYNAAQMGALTDANSRIRIERCRIDGFGQSGILADQCTNLWIERNAIFFCGRDGVRMYGAVRTVVRGNVVGNLGPGYDGDYPNWNVYGVTATRVFGNATVPDANSAIFRPSEDVLVEGNHIYNCHTWKSLDTHGGVNVRFVGNHCVNSYIGIGADQAGTDNEDGINPVRGLIVANNLLESSGAQYMRAGMTLYGHDGTTQAIVDVSVTGNVIKGYGGSDTDGAISVSNGRRLTINGNTIKDAPRAAICLDNVAEDIAISGNIVNDPRMYVTVAVTAGGSGYTDIPTVTFTGGGGAGMKAVALVTGGSVTGISIVHPGTGYTSAPTVSITGGGGSGATAAATLNTGYGVLSQTATATATINNNIFRNETQAGMRAISLQAPSAGYGVKVGNENRFMGTVTKVYPSLASEAGGSFGRIPHAIARVNSAGSITSSIGIASVTKTGTGTYSVVLSTAASSINNLIPDATPYGSLNVARASMVDASSLTVTTATTAGAAADAAFVLTVWNVSP